jgi:hypothetical protein
MFRKTYDPIWSEDGVESTDQLHTATSTEKEVEVQHPYERELEIMEKVFSLLSFGWEDVPWAEFLLNPRRLRGSDFLMRWSQGVWSEKRMLEAVNSHGEFVAVAYGPSGVAPKEPREHELYFERLEEAGLGEIKRPDLLLFRGEHRDEVQDTIAGLGGQENLPFLKEDSLSSLLHMAIVGIECENSLWIAKQMPDYAAELRPMGRLEGRPGLPKDAVLPTVIVKEEDLDPLREWQQRNGVPIHVWHSFYDMAFGLSWTRLEELITSGLIVPRIQQYQAPGGATTEKSTYFVYHQYAYEVGTTTSDPQLIADSITDRNGHILPYVRFEGGSMTIHAGALEELRTLGRRSD